MFAIIPVEISQIIFGHVEDKETLARLLLVSHTFRRLAEPYLYRDVSFCLQREYTIQKFILGIAAGGGRCARFLKRLHLPIVSPQHELYELFQTIFALVSNLEDLELYPSRWSRLLTTFDLRDFLDVSPSASALKRFAWYSHCSLDSIGLTWFLTCQQSLECLTLMTFHTADAIPTLPKLRVLHALNLAAARRSLETNRVTHLQIRDCTASLDLHDAALSNVVVCILRVDSTLDVLSEGVAHMSNLECLKHVFVGGIVSALPAYALFPVINAFAQAEGLSRRVCFFVWLQIVVSIGVCLSYGAIYILVSESAPNSRSLGAVHGVSHIATGVMRAIEPYLYADVSFFGANHVQLKEPSDAELLAMGRSFLLGIAAGWGRCAHYVKRLYLPGAVLLRRELYKLFQTILQTVRNLEDLQVHCSWWIASPGGFNLQTLFETPPLFQLQGFGWSTPGHLDRVGLDWFLSHQTSLERLFLPSLRTSESSFLTPVLPRLRILHAMNSVAARRFLAGNQVTHLRLEQGDVHGLDDTLLRPVVVCITGHALFGSTSTAVARMPNLECLQIDAFAQSIPRTLCRLGMFKSATKLRHLRILTHEAIAGRAHSMPAPWDYGDVDIAFNSLPSLTYISVQFTSATIAFATMAGARDSAQAKPRKKPGRVPTSCAECRRLKLRCDRSVPCEKCVSRGCGSICPDGALTPGKGNRLVLANTEELHDRIDTLCARIRELEDALRTLQASVSTTPHPLLTNDLLSARSPQQPTDSPVPPSTSTRSPAVDAPHAEEESMIDAFGTLTIGPRGEANFLGQTARSEYLIRASLGQSLPQVRLPQSRLSTRVVNAGCPEGDLSGNVELFQDIIGHIPPRAESERLIEVYLEFGKILFGPLLRRDIDDQVLGIVYSPESFDGPQVHHAIALLFAILSIAVLFDPNRPPYSPDAHEYFLLSRAALSLSPPTFHTTLNSILTLTHLAEFLELHDWEFVGSIQGWVYLGYAFRLAYGVSLYLNGARWHLSDQMVERRSRVFWQLLSRDTWMSFSFGRPSSILLAHVDCEFPKDNEEVINSQGQAEMGFHPWCWRYSALLQSVISTAFVPKPPPYATILELDRKIRDFPIPSHLRPACVTQDQIVGTAFDVQRWFVLCSKETVLLNLHRGYFAQALQEQPLDYLKHRYGPSMLATYRSAWRLIETVIMSYNMNTLIMSRVAFAWSQALSASIVMCLLVTRAPSSNLTASALEELDRALLLFEKAAPTCKTASLNVDAMRTLRNKAHEAINRTDPSAPISSMTPAELDRIGGKTHLLSTIAAATTSTTTATTISSSGPSRCSSTTLTDVCSMDHLFAGINMHPTIAQDLRNLDIGAPLFNRMTDLPPNFLVSASSPMDAELAQSVGQPQPMPDVEFLDLFRGGMGGPPTSTGLGGGGASLPGVPGMNVLGGYPMAPTYPPGSPSNTPVPPTLDAAWQSLVEHLGFS
ncbi:hypothetical protein EYR40_003259 [Pleurotus pulmonarius]|nr:hypothetical protein EYR40_003259 [Pleurotus pulmonarius]